MADGTLFGRTDRLNVIDLFCGAGGFSLGAQWALGYGPTAAVNHDPHSILIHTKNHPSTIHFQEDVFHVAPWEAARGRRIDLLIGSPDCTHFSVAKGAAPRDSGRRSLAEVFVKWAKEIKPRVIILENVREFEGWGPLLPDGKPDPARKGEDFRRWVLALESEGYRVEWRLLRACDYGAPTSRLRFFLVARCDGQPIVWPEPTHGDLRGPRPDGLLELKPWRTAAECIDWSIPCRSIFGRSRPLKPATEKRIAAGIVKYVLNNPQPFLLCTSHGGRLEPITEPLRTVTTAKGGERALVAAFLAKHYTGAVGSDLAASMGTVTGVDHHSLVAAHLTKFYGTAGAGCPLTDPMPTVLNGGGKGGGHAGLVAAFLQKYYGSDGQNQGLDRPLDTATVKARFGLVTVEIGGEPYALVDIGMRMLEPRELARAQGFPDSFILEGTKADQIARIGNSVCPPVAEALVRANVGAV
jgi:DNA (cytosine-5)-methyltransferase 1